MYSSRCVRCAGTSGCCRICKHALRVIDGSWPMMSAAQGFAAAAAAGSSVLLGRDEFLLYLLLLPGALAPVLL